MFGESNFKQPEILQPVGTHLSIDLMKFELWVESKFKLADNVQLYAISNWKYTNAYLGVLSNIQLKNIRLSAFFN